MLDPKKTAKKMALERMMMEGEDEGPAADDGTIEPGVPVKTAPIELMMDKSERTPAIILDTGPSGAGELGPDPRLEPAAKAPGDETELINMLKELLGKGVEGVKSLGSAPFEAVGALDKLTGGKPKMTDVKAPGAVTVKEQAVTVVPDASKRKKKNFWHSNEEE